LLRFGVVSSRVLRHAATVEWIPPDARVAAFAGRQHGRIRADQLAECGLNGAAVRRRVSKGYLHRVHRGVYAVGHGGETLHARFMAAVLAGGEGAVLSHWSAAALWGLVSWDERPVDITVPRAAARDRQGIRSHRSRSLFVADVTREYGIPVTRAARALLDIAPQLSDQRLKRLVRKAVAERVTSVEAIAELVARTNGHRATKRLALLVADGPAPTESGDEDVVLELLLRAGVGPPAVNVPLVVSGTPYRPDMRWPAARLILEVDSRWHDGRLAKELDADRQADLEAAGERVLRTTAEQATQHPQQLVRRLVAAGAPYTDAQP
jgi:predicted transcriptional regulator of viral defense system